MLRFSETCSPKFLTNKELLGTQYICISTASIIRQYASLQFLMVRHTP